VAVLERDEHRCRWPRTERRSGICGSPANQVDHWNDRDSYALEDLWSLCQYHHMHKTGMQGAEAQRRLLEKTRYPAERAPGIL
jgi:5-methylcytosine-specific restriction endonuclease McrA